MNTLISFAQPNSYVAYCLSYLLKYSTFCKYLVILLALPFMCAKINNNNIRLMAVYGRSHHNTAFFLNYVTFYPICFGSWLHNLCFVFKMLLYLERGAKTHKTNAKKITDTFFVIFLDFFGNWQKNIKM